MPNDIRNIKRRVFRHAFEDGIFEIVFGVFALFIGLFIIGDALVSGHSKSQFALPFGYLSGFLIGLFLIKKVLPSLKAKTTFSRTGYVSFQDRKQKRLKAGIRGALAGGITALMGGLMTVASPVFDSHFYPLPVSSGVALAFVLFLISFRSGLFRFAVLGGFSLAFGLVSSFAPLSHWQSLSAFMGCVGASLLTSGWLSMRRFLRCHPLSMEDR